MTSSEGQRSSRPAVDRTRILRPSCGKLVYLRPLLGPPKRVRRGRARKNGVPDGHQSAPGGVAERAQQANGGVNLRTWSPPNRACAERTVRLDLRARAAENGSEIGEFWSWHDLVGHGADGTARRGPAPRNESAVTLTTAGTHHGGASGCFRRARRWWETCAREKWIGELGSAPLGAHQWFGGGEQTGACGVVRPSGKSLKQSRASEMVCGAVEVSWKSAPCPFSLWLK